MHSGAMAKNKLALRLIKGQSYLSGAGADRPRLGMLRSRVSQSLEAAAGTARGGAIAVFCCCATRILRAGSAECSSSWLIIVMHV